MSHPIRFHALIVPTVSWPELLRRAKWVEELGFEAVALPDYPVDWTNPPAPWHDGTLVIESPHLTRRAMNNHRDDFTNLIRSTYPDLELPAHS